MHFPRLLESEDASCRARNKLVEGHDQNTLPSGGLARRRRVLGPRPRIRPPVFLEVRHREAPMPFS